VTELRQGGRRRNAWSDVLATQLVSRIEPRWPRKSEAPRVERFQAGIVHYRCRSAGPASVWLFLASADTLVNTFTKARQRTALLS
jgi:hypothetical protein